jgi:hypothetical protein
MNPKSDPAMAIKNLLASLIGVEAEDIKNEDYLDEDLHMGPTEIADFLSKMQEKGLNVSDLEKPSELTVGEIAEIINE